MTLKKEAEDLLDKFNDHIEHVSDYRYELEFAKKRALLCLQERKFFITRLVEENQLDIKYGIKLIDELLDLIKEITKKK